MRRLYRCTRSLKNYTHPPAVGTLADVRPAITEGRYFVDTRPQDGQVTRLLVLTAAELERHFEEVKEP